MIKRIGSMIRRRLLGRRDWYNMVNIQVPLLVPSAAALEKGERFVRVHAPTE